MLFKVSIVKFERFFPTFEVIFASAAVEVNPFQKSSQNLKQFSDNKSPKCILNAFFWSVHDIGMHKDQKHNMEKNSRPIKTEI